MRYIETNYQIISDALLKCENPPYYKLPADEYSLYFPPLSALGQFIELVQANDIMLPDFYNHFNSLLQNLSEMADHNSKLVAIIFRSFIQDRVINTCKIEIAEIAFVFIREGYLKIKSKIIELSEV